MDKLINLVHAHGTMAMYFVQGGNRTLQYISEFIPKGIVLPANSYE